MCNKKCANGMLVVVCVFVWLVGFSICGGAFIISSIIFFNYIYRIASLRILQVAEIKLVVEKSPVRSF